MRTHKEQKGPLLDPIAKTEQPSPPVEPHPLICKARYNICKALNACRGVDLQQDLP